MAGTTYPESLNRDAQTIKTPAYYDSILREWVMLSQMAVLNGAGQPTKAQLDAWNRFAATVYAPDGAIDSLGARADVAQTDTTQAATAIALLKGLIELGKTVGTENTLQLIQTALGGLNEKDFATQATLAQVLTKLGDLSTATNQEAVKLVLDTISNAVAAKATEQTLGEIKTALTDGTQQVQLTGNIVEMEQIASQVVVAPGSTVTLKTMIRHDIQDVSMVARATISTTYRLKLLPETETAVSIVSLMAISNDITQAGGLPRTQLATSRARLQVENKGESDIAFDVWAYYWR